MFVNWEIKTQSDKINNDDDDDEIESSIREFFFLLFYTQFKINRYNQSMMMIDQKIIFWSIITLF